MKFFFNSNFFHSFSKIPQATPGTLAFMKYISSDSCRAFYMYKIILQALRIKVDHILEYWKRSIFLIDHLCTIKNQQIYIYVYCMSLNFFIFFYIWNYPFPPKQTLVCIHCYIQIDSIHSIIDGKEEFVQVYSDVTSVTSVFVSDKIIIN